MRSISTVILLVFLSLISQTAFARIIPGTDSRPYTIRPSNKTSLTSYSDQESINNDSDDDGPVVVPLDGGAMDDDDDEGPAVTVPHAFNIDFGVWRPAFSKKSGPAAAGKPGDFWNSVAVAWNDDHTERGLLSTNRKPSPIRVRMVNLGGGWGTGDDMGVKDPMFQDFNYPANNKGGNSEVVMSNIPAGRYQLYLYGHGTDPVYYGDYTLFIGGKEIGRKMTSNQPQAVSNPRWTEGDQYVKFPNIDIKPGQDVRILIRPGGTVTDNGGGRWFADAMICGLQLIPVDEGLPW